MKSEILITRKMVDNSQESAHSAGRADTLDNQFRLNLLGSMLAQNERKRRSFGVTELGRTVCRGGGENAEAAKTPKQTCIHPRIQLCLRLTTKGVAGHEFFAKRAERD